MIALDLHQPALSEGCLSDLALDRVITRERPGSLPEQADHAHLAQCLPCTRRLRQLEREAEGFLAQRPTLAPGRSWRFPSPARVAGVMGVAAAAAVALLVVRPPATGSAPDVRLKGPPIETEVYARGGDGRVTALLPGGVAHPGDALRFRVTAGRVGFLGIVSVDGRGAVTAYAPNASSLDPVAAGESRLLEGSVVLDEVLGRENLLVFLCEDRLATSALVKAVGRVPGAVLLEPSAVSHFGLACAHTSFWFTKVPSRER